MKLSTTDAARAAASRTLAEQAGAVPYLRARTPGVRAPFISSLADMVLQTARGEIP